MITCQHCIHHKQIIYEGSCHLHSVCRHESRKPYEYLIQTLAMAEQCNMFEDNRIDVEKQEKP